MNNQTDHNDERLLETLKERFNKENRDRFYDQRVQNLSVDVLREQDRRRSRRSTIRTGSLAVASAAAAVLLLIVQPWQAPAPEPIAVTTESYETTDANAASLAAEYVDALIEEESVDLLMESTTADPVMLTEQDIDQLFEGL